ncbi:MAG: hypothetical protein ACYSWU_24805 [Planctomycetota bacterium]|jgi:hypothetical protein
MDSLAEVEFAAVDFMKGHAQEAGTSLWDALVRSAYKLNGDACDGLLVSKVGKYIERLLEGVDDQRLREIWLETENGMMSVADGYDMPDRCEMTHDIGLDAQWHIVEEACEEARRLGKRRRKRSK